MNIGAIWSDFRTIPLKGPMILSIITPTEMHFPFPYMMIALVHTRYESIPLKLKVFCIGFLVGQLINMYKPLKILKL